MLADESTAIVEVHQIGTNTVPSPLGDGDRELLGTDLAWIPPTGRSVDVTGVVVLTTTRGPQSALSGTTGPSTGSTNVSVCSPSPRRPPIIGRPAHRPQHGVSAKSNPTGSSPTSWSNRTTDCATSAWWDSQEAWQRFHDERVDRRFMPCTAAGFAEMPPDPPVEELNSSTSGSEPEGPPVPRRQLTSRPSHRAAGPIRGSSPKTSRRAPRPTTMTRSELARHLRPPATSC